MSLRALREVESQNFLCASREVKSQIFLRASREIYLGVLDVGGVWGGCFYFVCASHNSSSRTSSSSSRSAIGRPFAQLANSASHF